MFCEKCGAQITEEAKFCSKCGHTVSNFAVQNEIVGIAKQPKKPMDKKRKFVLTVLICAAAAILIGGIATFMVIDGGKAGRFTEAMNLLDSGKALEAQEVFKELGGYRSSSDKVKDCQNMLDYDAAAQKMEKGDYADAKVAFETLGAYKDSSSKALECRSELEYKEATAKLAAGDFTAAKQAFEALVSYKDSASLATECRNMLDYNAAKALMDGKEYEKAMAAFNALGTFKDAAQLAKTCQNQIDYNAADAVYKEGKYYTAYLMFQKLGDFGDSAARAQSCKQPLPKTGELYRNQDFSAKKVSFTIKSPKDAAESTFIKIYTENDVLVSSVFLETGKNAKVKLPTGKYKIKTAYGKDWYGAEDMYGDEGYYKVLTFEGGAETYAFKSSRVYTLTLGGVKNGNVGAKQQSRDQF